jgi:hypothetical protein
VDLALILPIAAVLSLLPDLPSFIRGKIFRHNQN